MAIEVIQAATISGAEILDLDSIGKIAVSKAADILIVDGNPISDMRPWKMSRRYIRAVRQFDGCVIGSGAELLPFSDHE